MSVQAQLNGTISLTDNLAGSTQLQKQVALSFLGTIAAVAQSQPISTSPVTITLPVTPTQFVYIKNLSTSATVTVTWTPNGGTSNQVATLQPGSLLILVEGNTTSGITALSLTASTGGTLVEYFLVG